jgi:hypothetical protein
LAQNVIFTCIRRGFSVAVSLADLADTSALILFVQKTEKLKPVTLEKANWTKADAPAPMLQADVG